MSEAERRQAYGMTMPASNGEPVCQGHADWCAEHGHAVWTVDGERMGTCPRCGHVTEASPRVATLADVIETDWYRTRTVGPDKIGQWSVDLADSYLSHLSAPPLTEAERAEIGAVMSARIFPDGE